jgi:cytochrome P450
MTSNEVYYDPYNREIALDPWPVFRRLRDEAPVYFNEQYGFWVLSRYHDVHRGLLDDRQLISGRGTIPEIISAYNGQKFPAGTFIFEDPPDHTVHRGLLSRVFTPKKMDALVPQIREYCIRCLDPWVGSDGFDLVEVLCAEMPMRVIGMLLGMPEAMFEEVREGADEFFTTEVGQPMKSSVPRMAILEEYLDWRIQHPSDDLVTMLLNCEFTDIDGRVRTIDRDEALSYLNLLAVAGNETTGRLISWIGKVLGDHPDQRRLIAAEPLLVSNAVEEVLRFEPITQRLARYSVQDVDYHGVTIPAGSVVVLLTASANRDERHFANPDVFEVRRNTAGLLSFGFGLHFCLGASLARTEGRVALEEMLKRFPDWEVDYSGLELAVTSGARGWTKMPLKL